MGKTRDLIQILIIVIIGIFIPFFGSLILSFNIDITKTNNLMKIFSTFLWFLLLFGIELFAVYLYFQITSKIAGKKLDEYKNK